MSEDRRAKRQVGRRPKPEAPLPPPLWESPAIAKQVDDILIALEVGPIDAESRGVFQRMIQRQKYFGGDANGRIIFTIRCITESNGNEGALIGPVVRAVSSCLTPEVTNRGLEVIESFDKIPLVSIFDSMRSLNAFDEYWLGHYYSIAIRNKLAAILEPAVQPKPKPVSVKKPPRHVTRIPEIERKIALGLQLLELRSQAKGNIEFGRLRRKLGVEPVSAQGALRVATAYGRRPEIYRRLTWMALLELSSPSLSADARTDIEAKIMAGDRFSHTQIRARRPLRSGAPKKEPARMAA